jgi:hypothetical protein
MMMYVTAGIVGGSSENGVWPKTAAAQTKLSKTKGWQKEQIKNNKRTSGLQQFLLVRQQQQCGCVSRAQQQEKKKCRSSKNKEDSSSHA